ncbi:MAG: hypothetical protein HY234_13825 [Acidobacteria bacterium]|nr:hypothetical protein [Acidobacteriota bacterium]
MAETPKTTFRDITFLLLLTATAVLVHGYHFGVEDQSIYLPAIKKTLDPALFPHDAQFFLTQAHWMLYGEMVALSIRISHLPLEWAMLLWHGAAVFLVLLGCLRIGRRCFADTAAPWAGVAMVASLMTIPVAGTLVLMVDQYAHPRVLATAFALLALGAVLDRRPRALAWLALTAITHPQVALYAAVHLLFQVRFAAPAAGAVPAALFLWGTEKTPAGAAMREIVRPRRQHFPLQWTWYEWLGAYGPVLLLGWFARWGRKNGAATLARVCAGLAASCAAGIAAALLITTVPQLEPLIALRPMRELHFVYVLLFLLGGGLLGRCVLRDRAWRWALLFLPICAGMFLAQRAIFPASPHIEWPGRAAQNEWLDAFAWIRANTPRDALFALDPMHMNSPGEDNHGFRALAERSMLVDFSKDRSVASLFPALAGDWKEQFETVQGWKIFRREDFVRLRAKYGVTWVVLEQPAAAELPCPYANARVRVCRVE